MKLVSLYSNYEDVFPSIRFRDGFNVVFARVKNPQIKERDSHNLGKTFLIQVIDFGLLEKVDSEHPFKSEQLFGDFVFYLEIETNNKQYITVQRKVTGRNSVSIHIDKEAHKDLRDLPHSEWTFPSLSVEAARDKLNELLELAVIRPYSYRKGLGYCLRSQEDYAEEFRISQFGRGKDRDWKPYLALILGFDQALVMKKYEQDENINELLKYRQKLEKEAKTQSERYDELRGLIEIRQINAEKLRDEIDRFSFRELEAEISESVVVQVEGQIAELNQDRYVVDVEIEEIDRSLRSEFAFDVDKIEEIFREAQISLPSLLVHDYHDLVEFNKRLSGDRSKRLRELRERLIAQRQAIDIEIKRLDEERQTALAVLRERETLKKYKGLQRRLLQYEEEILGYKEQLAYLDRAVDIRRKEEESEQKRDSTVAQLQEALRRGSDTYSSIRKTFSEYVEHVLNVPALLSVSINQQNNLDFKIRILDRSVLNRETSEGQGTSYKKLLCACFDLAVLSVYASRSFYRFVYHDGIFEGLDNRKKVSLLNLIRRVCSEKNIQYILTVIDSDLPRDERDQKLLFTEEEIVRELHDGGDQGRLFRMKAF